MTEDKLYSLMTMDTWTITYSKDDVREENAKMSFPEIEAVKDMKEKQEEKDLARESIKKRPPCVTNRTKEGVNPTTFTSGRDASRLACTQVHAAAGCRPCTAGTPSSTAQLPVDAALNAHGLTLLMALL